MYGDYMIEICNDNGNFVMVEQELTSVVHINRDQDNLTSDLTKVNSF